LAVINTGQRKDDSKALDNQGSGGKVSVAGVVPSVVSGYWEKRTAETGEEYLFSPYPVAVQYGLTSYVDGGELDLPDIYDGLRIDNQTIYWEKTTEETTDEEGNVVTHVVKVLKAQGGGGGGVQALLRWSGPSPGSWDGTTEANIEIPNDTSQLTNGAGYVTSSTLNSYVKSSTLNNTLKSYVKSSDLDSTLTKYVHKTNDQEIGGTKNFTGKLQVNGNTIVYNKSGRYWMLDGNLLVTGGITTYADEGKGNQWIMDATSLSGVTSTNQYKVYSARVTTMLAEKVVEMANKLETIKNALIGIDKDSSAAAIGSALEDIYEALSK
jgi:hypothetical protein